MDESDRRTAKRSRFDQKEPEPRRPSRFDRRSRSPPSRKAEPARSRSPFHTGDDSAEPTPMVDPAAAAAAAAAKINAQLQARKGTQHSDMPPIKSPAGKPASVSSGTGTIKTEMYIADGDYIKDIEVNDLRNRYLLTKGSTQKMIKDETGADVTTRGSYYPDKSMATAANPPLYLHVTSTSKEGLEKAIAKIEELMKQELPQLVDERRFRRREEQPPVERDEYGRRKWPEEKIPINLEPIPGFNLRAQVVGHGGSYVKHIQQETGCRVQIKGRGSGYIESSTGRESEDDMFLHVAGPDPKMVEKAKEMCEDLLGAVKEQYQEFKSRPPRFNNDRPGGYGDRHRDSSGGHHSHQGYSGHSRGGYDHGHSHHGQGHSHSHGPNHGPNHGPGSSYGQGHTQGNGSGQGGYNNSSTSAAPPAPAAPAAAPQASSQAPTVDYSQYAQYYGGTDPYAAWGGYTGYLQMYQQYYASQVGQQGAAATPAASSTSLPPPPPSDTAPPPPPPPSSAPPPPPPGSAGPPGAPGASGSYSAVPPPPGL